MAKKNIKKTKEQMREEFREDETKVAKKKYVKHLTPEEIKFAEELIFRGSTGAEAYRVAFNYEGGNVYTLASKVRKRERVQSYMEDLKHIQLEEVKFEHEFILYQYKVLLSDKKTSNKEKRQILNDLSKITGLLVDKQININTNSDVNDMTDEELEHEIEKLKSII